MRQIYFEGIDDWNRAVFKAVENDCRYGSVEVLFNYGDTEDKILKVLTEESLVYFGREFNCEPMGDLPRNELKIIEKGEMA